MKISHCTKKGELEKDSSNFFSCFISDGSGGYLSLGEPCLTQYQGWFTFLEDEFELYKILADIRLEEQEENNPHEKLRSENGSESKPAIKKIINSKKSSRIVREKSEEELWAGKNVIGYTIKGYNGKIMLDFDMRRIHDYDDLGRIYNINYENGAIIIEYIKYEDSRIEKIKEKFYVAVITNLEWSKKNEWRQVSYKYDAFRKVKDLFYVYIALELRPTKSVQSPQSYGNNRHLIALGFSKNKEEAIKYAKKEYTKLSIPIIKKIRNQKFKNVKDVAETALRNLIIRHEKKEAPGIFAGLPWFYQIWTRDELISLAGLLADKKNFLAKKILIKHLDNLDKRGTLPNRYPESLLGSADGTGLLYKRIQNIMHMGALTKKDIEKIYQKLSLSIETKKTEIKEGLFFNNPKETWMDTDEGQGKDTRAGWRVEIQALNINMYRLMKQISIKGTTSYQEAEKKENELKIAVRQKMMKNGILQDGINSDGSIDETTRPNIFLAYYYYPDLLSGEEWKKTFDNALEECWLEWGGLSSISKRSNLFQPIHTGIDNKSYHRGDSWYFLANIAAICMCKIDKEYYHEKIKKIKEASVNEMLFSGFIGQCAEISSANKQDSSGCLAQAWSAATLIELLSTDISEE